MRFALSLLLPLSLLGCGGVAVTTDAGADSAVGMESSVSDGSLSPDANPVLEASAPEAATEASAGSDGSLLPPVDAGNPFGDAGPLGPPAVVPVTVRTSGSCDALAPCGGDVVGTWDVTGVCVELPIADTVMRCPGGRITRADGTAQGRVTFDGVRARRAAQSNVQVDLFLPALCAAAAGGCDVLAGYLRSVNPDSACVATATGDCNCSSRLVTTIDDGDGYTAMNNTITSTTLRKQWAYCIAGTSLRYQDVSPSGPREPGIVTLGRR